MTHNQLKSYHILNTRPQRQASALSRCLREHGAQVTEQPAIDITFNHIQADIHNINQYDIVIFVSANAADAVAAYWQPCNATVLCVGPATQHAVHKFHSETTTPRHFSSSGLLELPQLKNIKNNKVIIMHSWRYRLQCGVKTWN